MTADKPSNLVPKLRFAEFVDEPPWECPPLKKLAKRITQRNTHGADLRALTNSAEHGVVDQREYFDRDIATNTDNYYIVETGDYVYNSRISSTAPVGPISKNQIGTGVMSPLYTVFRFRSDANDFFAHYFRSSHWHGYLRGVSNNGARHDRMAVTNDDLMQIPIPTPSPREQQKIADCLGSLDDLIAAENRKLEVLRQHKNGLMQQVFPQPGESEPILRFPDSDDGSEWQYKVLPEIATNLNNMRIPVTEQDRRPGEVPYYGASGIVDYVKDHIFDEDLLCVSEDGANLVARTSPIAFSISGRTWVNNHAHVLRFQKSVTQILVQAYLNHIDISDYITGVAQPKLNRAMLDSIPIALPPTPDEQNDVAGCIASFDHLLSMHQKKIESLSAHKKSLLLQLFPGLEEGSR